MTWPYGPGALIAARQRCSAVAKKDGMLVARVSLASSRKYCSHGPKHSPGGFDPFDFYRLIDLGRDQKPACWYCYSINKSDNLCIGSLPNSVPSGFRIRMRHSAHRWLGFPTFRLGDYHAEIVAAHQTGSGKA